MEELITVTGGRVRLAEDWRDRIDPRALHTAVTAAVQRAAAEAASTAPAREPVPPAGDRIKAELAAFSRQVASFDDRPSWVDSDGGHVACSSVHGLVRQFEIDARWARTAPTGHIEAELTDVLTRLHPSL